MKVLHLLVFAAGLLAIGCNRAPDNSGGGGAEIDSSAEPQFDNKQNPSAATSKQGSAIGRSERRAYDSAFHSSDKATTPTDDYLVRNIRRTMAASDHFGRLGDYIGIEANNGRVKLTGRVTSENEKKAFGSWVERITGVTSLDNQLTVGGRAGLAEAADHREKLNRRRPERTEV